MRSRLIASAAALALALSPAVGFISAPARAQSASTVPGNPAPAPSTASAPVAPAAAATVDPSTGLGAITPPSATVDTGNPYGLGSLWAGGDFVARGVLVVLAILSAGSWYILFAKLYEQSRLFTSAREADKNFWAGGRSLKDNLGSLNTKGAFHFVAANGLSAAAHHEGTLIEHIDLNTWVGQSIQRSVEKVASRLSGGLAFLATVGSTAPFIGLFGTVWGIYHALVAIGIAGQASIDKVAGPVGEALIMTAVGLAVAVPAVLSYNWLVRRNKSALEQLRNFGADLHGVLLSQVNQPATPASRAA